MPYYDFALKPMQYPCGEIDPSTILQVPFELASEPGIKKLHPEHCMLPFGESW